MKTTAATLIMIFGAALGFLPLASADVVIPGMGSGAYDVPSVGGPGDAVDKAPVCDNRARPKITKVTPDTLKPGDKVTIQGENFGKKECFHGVFFGSGGASGAATSYQLVNETTIEATVPDVKIGLGKLNVVTSGGSAQAIILLQAK
ncbi:MAG: IPT/TIG domain-containing protein [Nitrospirales bacterium]|nr:IPT/TIG domain-containing protein [Nitrospirales bacterium]